jgi:hypothetical protein
MKTLQISDDTYELIKSQLKEEEKIDVSNIEDLIGKKWFFRTVTYHMVGFEKLFKNKSFEDIMKTGKLDEGLKKIKENFIKLNQEGIKSLSTYRLRKGGIGEREYRTALKNPQSMSIDTHARMAKRIYAIKNSL